MVLNQSPSQQGTSHGMVDVGQPIDGLLASVNDRGVVHLSNWGYDVKQAFEQSKTTGKPVIIMLTADWCGPCQMLKKEVLALPSVDKMVHEKFTPVVWDITDPTDSDAQMAEKWEVTGEIPTVLMFDANADKPIKRIVGAVSQQVFEKWINS